MIALLFIISCVWGGLILDKEFSLSRGDGCVRLAAGLVLGCFCGTWLVFLLSLAFGFNAGVIGAALIIVSGGNLYAWKRRHRDLAWLSTLFTLDRRFWSVAAGPTLLITAYFASCVWIGPRGDFLFEGNSTDLAFHMGTVSAFVEQSAFPPFNPQSAGARLSYHFMANFFSAILCKGGFSLFSALKIPMVLFAFTLGTLTCHLLYTLLKSRVAMACASILFFFGHIGTINLLFAVAGYPVGNVPFSLGNGSSIVSQITFPYFNFQNAIISLFQPQLPFLFGFPLATLILVALYNKFVEASGRDRTTYLLLALIAFLPLLHMHSFLTLGPLVILLVLFEGAPPVTNHTTAWLKTGALLLTTGIPIALQFAYILSQEKVPGFSGFDVAEKLGDLSEIPNFLHLKRVFFWVRTAGAPLLLGSAGLVFTLGCRPSPPNPAQHRSEQALTFFFCLTSAFFIFINFYRFTPNWGDSNKFVLYFNLALCAYAGRICAGLWAHSPSLKFLTCGILALAAIIPTGIEWGGRYLHPPECLYSASDRMVADWIRLNTPADSVFMTANSTVHFVPALAGRRVVNGAYTRETGYASAATEAMVAQAYQESNPALISSSPVNYILVSPQEEALYYIDRSTLGRRFKLVYDQVSENTSYAIYETRLIPPSELTRDEEIKKARPYIWLSELTPSFAQQDFDVLKYNKAISLGPLTLQGKKYPYGLGTHAHSEIHFNLAANYSSFSALVGLDDSQLGGPGSITFEVWVDGRLAFKSTVLRAGDRPDPINISVEGAQQLRLVVTDAGNGIQCDHADWANAMLYKQKPPASNPAP